MKKFMFGKRITLLRLFGISVYVDLSWLVIGGLVAWALARDWFPRDYPELSQYVFWAMGVVGAAGLLFSIVFHEMAHSLVAKQQGISIRGITLFVFGGVAEMDDEPPSAKSEFLMTIVGPLSSLFLSGVFWVLAALCLIFKVGSPVVGVLGYLTYLNFWLAIFNMVPAFPLDGGRVLRALLWALKGDLRWATSIASNLGSAFGILLITMGVFMVFLSQLWGIWMVFIGFFVWNAARMSYQQMLIRRGLEGEPVKMFMRENPITVAPQMSLRELVEHYVYRYHYKMFPVIANDRLMGCVTIRNIKDVAQQNWEAKTVADIMQLCSQENTIEPDADAMQALSRMNRNKVSRLMVVENGNLKGIISLKDLLDFLSLKVQLEDK